MAVIENTYPSYFRVKFEEAGRVGSYNYTDLFTRTVELKMYNGEEYESIIPPPVENKRHRKINPEEIENLETPVIVNPVEETLV